MISRTIYFTGATAGGFTSVSIPFSIRPTVMRSLVVTAAMTIAAGGLSMIIVSPSQDVVFFSSDGPAKLAVLAIGGTPGVAVINCDHIEVYFPSGFPISQNLWVHGSVSGAGNSVLGWATAFFDDY